MAKQSTGRSFSATQPFLVGDWHVDPSTLRISRDNLTREIDPRLMAVLCELAGNADVPARPVYAELLCEGILAPIFMIRRGRNKFITSTADPDILFDLEQDSCDISHDTRIPRSRGAFH